VLIALLLLAGFSFVTGYWIADHAPTLGQCLKVTLPIAAIVQGVIVGCWLGFERYKLQSAWLTRLLIAALVGIVVVTSPSPLDGIVRASREPSVPEKVVAKVEQKVAEKLEGRGRSRTAARDERVADAEPKSRVDKIGPIGPIVDAASAIKTSQPIALPIILLMLLADWPKRYYGGRRGQISLGLAFYAWLGTLIVANITGVTPAMPVALIVAAASLALQAVAGLWPLADATAIPLPIRRELGALGRDPDVGPRVTPVVTSKFGEFIGRRKRGAHAEEAARTPVPVLPASGGGRDAQEKNARTSRRGGWLLAIGIVWSCALGAVIPALVHVFNRTPNQWLIPTFLIPNFMCAVGLIIWGALLLHAAAKRNPFVLPLRRVFDVPHSADLAATIERHFIALSYSIDARDDLLWTFRRKSSGWSRFWGHTIRASVAGYRLAGGGCQLRCYVDAEYTWDTPEKKEIQALWNELEELRSLLGAREIEEAAEAVA
jgi:hypothetical protein